MSQVWRGEDGEPRRGKTVTLDAEDIALHEEARELRGQAPTFLRCGITQ